MKQLTDPISGKIIEPDVLAICDLVVGRQAKQMNPSMLSHFCMLLKENPEHGELIFEAHNLASVGSWFRVQPRRVTPEMCTIVFLEKPWRLSPRQQDVWIQAHQGGA